MRWLLPLLTIACCWNLVALAQDTAVEPVRLTSGIPAGYPDWAPDGQSIVFATFGTETEEGDLYVVGAAGGEPWQLGFGGTHHGVFSPDGTYIVLDALRGTVVQIMPAAGGVPVRVVPESVPVEMSGNPCWSPDGQRLAFRTGEDLCLLDLPSGAITTALHLDGQFPAPVEWIPGQERLIVGYVVPGAPERNLWLVSLDGAEPVQLTSGIYHSQASASPDGSLLVYSAMNEQREAHLFVMAVDGGPSIQLTGGEVQDFEPDWSPDGRRIVFSSTREGMPSLWLLDVDPDALRAQLAGM